LWISGSTRTLTNQEAKAQRLGKNLYLNNLKSSTETGGKCHGVYRKHRPNECRTIQPKSQKAGKGRKGKPNKKKGDNDGNMDVVVAQQAIGDPSSPDDGDVLMGGYETE